MHIYVSVYTYIYIQTHTHTHTHTHRHTVMHTYFMAKRTLSTSLCYHLRGNIINKTCKHIEYDGT